MCFSSVVTGATVALWPAGDFARRHTWSLKHWGNKPLLCGFHHSYLFSCLLNCGRLWFYVRLLLLLKHPSKLYFFSCILTEALKVPKWWLWKSAHFSHSVNVCENIHSCPSHSAIYQGVTPSRGFPVLATQLIPHLDSHWDKRKLGKVLQARIQENNTEEVRLGGWLAGLPLLLLLGRSLLTSLDQCLLNQASGPPGQINTNLIGSQKHS